jgi:two-component sensor histidine kinase
MHEFTTNAAKYGAFSASEGYVQIECAEDGDRFILPWTERSGPRVEHRVREEGFGDLLVQATVKGAFGGEISRDWHPLGLRIRLSMVRHLLASHSSN